MIVTICVAIIAKEQSIAQQQKQINVKKNFFHIHINMIILSLDELKIIAKKEVLKTMKANLRMT